MVKPKDLQETVPLSAQRPGVIRTARDVLVIYHREGALSASLTAGIPLVIGRAQPADVILEDDRLSRRHASFELTSEGIVVCDLGSTNGTWVGGKRVESTRLPDGFEVQLGSAVVTSHRLQGQPTANRQEMGSHDEFLRRMDDELARAKHFGRAFSLLMLRSNERGNAALSRHVPTIKASLRPVDHMAVYSAGTGELLLPETANEEALRVAQGISQSCGLYVGVATYPYCGTTAERLIDACQSALRSTTADSRVQLAPAQAERSHQQSSSTDGPIIRSPAMTRLFSTVERVAKSSIPVLLHGETGVGKEVVAQAIHDAGPRKSEPLIFVNCGAIPSQLVESTLFGHMKGAFTGALQTQKGVFEAAEGGTVMLDEIGELPPSAQAALLRVLEHRKLCRVGSTVEVLIEARVIAATHRNLEEMCDQGTFRWDLLFRLNAITLEIPPLRERREDIEPLCQHFLREAAAREKNEHVLQLDPDAADALQNYSYPGNVRELRNAIERAIVIAQGPYVALDDLPDRVRRAADHGPATPGGDEPARDRVTHVEVKSSTVSDEASDETSYKQRIQNYERDLITRVLNDSGGSQTETARRLGMPVRTLMHKMRTFGIRKEFSSGE